MRKAGGAPLEYLKITLYDVIVSHVEPAANDGLDLEHVALSFARIKKEYVVQRDWRQSGDSDRVD